MKRLLSLLVPFFAACGELTAAVPLRWTVETSRLQPVQFDAVRGETLALEAAFKSYGNDVSTSNLTAALYWQTNGMANAWWVTNAVTSGSSASVLFTPAMDPGAPVVHAFLALASTSSTTSSNVTNPSSLIPHPSSLSYRAAITLRFRHGPGATPNAIAAPVPVLDLANTVVVNPPWPTTNDFITATNRMETTLKTYVDNQITGAGTVSPQIVTNIVESTVPSWAMAETPPQSMTGNALVYTNDTIKTQDGNKSFATYDAEISRLELNPTYLVVGATGLNGSNGEGHFNCLTFGEDQIRLEAGNSGTIAVTANIDDALEPVTSSVTSNRTNLATLSTQVSTIGAHLNAEDARFVSTNYNSSTRLPEAYVEIKMTDSATSSNSWYRIWTEMTRWDAFTGTNFTWTGWNGFYSWGTNIEAEVSAASPREYAFFDGVTGEAAPDGFFWISQPHVAVCAGAGYQRYVDGASEVWVLESNGLVADINGTTNGYFRITDSEGNAQFEIIKGDKQTVFANANALTRTSVNGVTHWFTTYSVTNAVEEPTAYFASSLTNATWYADDDDDCPCNVSWTSGSNSYTLEWWPKSTMPSMFVKADYQRGGDSYINNTAPVKMQTIIIGNKKYSLGTTTVNGETVLKLTEVN